MRRAAGLFIAALLASACGDDTVISNAGTMCALDSECNASLTCTFGRCHQECEEASDCDDDQMCVLRTGMRSRPRWPRAR